jgi:hypothetical protein
MSTPLATTAAATVGGPSSLSAAAAAQPLNGVEPFNIRPQRLPIVVVKRRRILAKPACPSTITAQQQQQQQSRRNDNKNQTKNDTMGIGLCPRQHPQPRKSHLQHKRHNQQDDNVDDDNGDNDAEFASYDALVQTWATTLHDNNPVTMSDTALALQSLVQSPDTCLEIPLAVVNGETVSSSLSNTMIRGVLECQLHNFFQSPDTTSTSSTATGATTTTAFVPVSRELDDLVHARHVTVLEASIRLNDAQTVPLVVYIATPDYLRGVQAARDDATATNTTAADTNGTATAKTPTITTSLDSALWDWFLSQIVRGTGHGRVIRHEDLVQSWTTASSAAAQTKSSSSSLAALESWLRQCQTEWNVLRVADSTHSAYQWWLPAWGAVVVPAVAHAAQRVVRRIQQSPQKQLSLRNLTTKLQPRSPISIANLVLPWLVAQGVVQCISRPSGTFVQLC